MTAVTIDANVVSGLGNKLTANPLLPIVGPVDIDGVTVVNVVAPVVIPDQAPIAVATPIDINGLSVGNVVAPVTITATNVDPESPPFALNHARILYDSVLSQSSVSVTGGTNGNYTLIPNTAQRYTFTNTQTITFTLPANVNIDTFCVGAHNLSGQSLVVNYSGATTGAFTSFDSSQSPTTNNAIMFHRASELSVRRIQLVVTGTGTFYIGSIYAGVALQMMRPFYGGHSPAVLSKRTDFYSSDSESGNFIGVQVRRRALESNADWKNLADTWYRAYFVPFLNTAETLPFYFAWNLLEHPTDVAYCKNVTDISPTYQGNRDLMSVGIPLIGIA
jgi:hypothetical protein